MAFERFISKGFKLTPQITLNNTGGFGLSSGMHKKYNVDKYLAVELYYDKEDAKIGIKLLENESDFSFKLKKRPEQKGAYFGAKSFLQSYSIDPKTYSGRYMPEEVEDKDFGKLFVIKLMSNQK